MHARAVQPDSRTEHTSVRTGFQSNQHPLSYLRTPTVASQLYFTHRRSLNPPPPRTHSPYLEVVLDAAEARPRIAAVQQAQVSLKPHAELEDGRIGQHAAQRRLHGRAREAQEVEDEHVRWRRELKNGDRVRLSSNETGPRFLRRKDGGVTRGD